LERLGAQVGESLYTGGGGSNSPVWLQIRADVLEKAIVKPKYADASLGCAILAASRTYYTSLVEAAQTMVKLEEPVQPNLKGRNDYQKKYELFKKELMKRGYIMD
jgi:sugar (pentulose or hexulose) kinase